MNQIAPTEPELQTDIKELEKLSAFVAPDSAVIAGLKLRPLSAGTLIQLKLTDNPLVEGKEAKDIEFQVAAFLYIHAANPKVVRKAVFDPQTFKVNVLEFAEGLSIPDFIAAAEQIKSLIENAVVGQDYEVKKADEPPSPN